MPGWSRIWGVPGNEAGQEEARFLGGGKGRGERTHETHQTAPSCLDYDVNAQCTKHVLNREAVSYPRRVSVNLWFSPSTSKIFIVLSEEHVASRRP